MKKIIFSLMVGLFLVAGCKQTEEKLYNVKLYNDGVFIDEWLSTKIPGNVNDFIYFNDSETGKYIKISGCIVVEQVK